ncbi:MAG TPA: L,D-transpeptidase family protein [Stellaceae bacterium]|nr:L,D-transpeptidase family protein [Stellaceae bacterium]
MSLLHACVVARVLILAAACTLVSPLAQAASFSLAPDQMLVGAPGVYVTRDEDTLLDVARSNDLGYGQLIAVNADIDPWLPGAGRSITLPTVYLVPEGPRRGIVINLAEQRLYYFPPDGHTLETYPIGVGVEAHMTPLGTTRVVGKEVRPTWFPPQSIHQERPELPEMVPPGPANPLGEYALRLGWPGYLIHGTNKPYGVGRNVSHGCIRLYPEDIKRLFSEVPVGTPVRVVDEEIRLAWVDDELYLAVTPSKRQMDELDVNQPMTPDVPPDLVDRVAAAAGTRVDRIDWRTVDQIGLKRPGMPLRITGSSLSSSDP